MFIHIYVYIHIYIHASSRERACARDKASLLEKCITGKKEKRGREEKGRKGIIGEESGLQVREGEEEGGVGESAGECVLWHVRLPT